VCVCVRERESVRESVFVCVYMCVCVLCVIDFVSCLESVYQCAVEFDFY